MQTLCSWGQKFWIMILPPLASFLCDEGKIKFESNLNLLIKEFKLCSNWSQMCWDGLQKCRALKTLTWKSRTILQGSIVIITDRHSHQYLQMDSRSAARMKAWLLTWRILENQEIRLCSPNIAIPLTLLKSLSRKWENSRVCLPVLSNPNFLSSRGLIPFLASVGTCVHTHTQT